MRLPRSSSRPDAGATAPHGPHVLRPEASPRILLVEDDAPSRSALSRLLVLKGYRVVAAPDITTALEDASGAEFDLVISDIVLPDGKGRDLVRHLWEGRGVPGVITSALPPAFEGGGGGGVVACLTKPVVFSEVERTFRLPLQGPAPTRRPVGSESQVRSSP